jgi:hypothetical protein
VAHPGPEAEAFVTAAAPVRRDGWREVAYRGLRTFWVRHHVDRGHVVEVTRYIAFCQTCRRPDRHPNL